MAAASGSLLGPLQGNELRHFVCISHLAATRDHWMLQPHCSASAEPGLGSGVGREQETKHRTPNPLPLPGRGHAPPLRGLRWSAVSNHLIVPWSLMTQFQDPSAVIKFREDTAIRYFSPGQVSCHTRLLDNCNSVCWVMWREETPKLPLLLSWRRCIKQKTNKQ